GTFATIVELGDGNTAARPSWDELVAILEHLGAVVVTRDEHGAFLRADRRLVFVRARGVVEDRELEDVLRGAGLSADRFAVLLANSRRLTA
ncbi:MAG TPA: hypothetical protein VHS09_08875, partial [Polyangiaceae bacterium]|nr:hypothetical protein [Polyangiaceae bacterium]